MGIVLSLECASSVKKVALKRSLGIIIAMLKRIIVFFILNYSLAQAWDSSDFKSESLSPFTTNAKNVFYAGAALTIGVLIFEDSIIDYTQRDISNDKPLGSLSKLGDLSGQLIPNAFYVIGQSLAFYSGDELGYSRAIGMIKATAYSSGLTTVLKYTIREPRPGNNSERNSFPSGHSTSAFAFGGYVYEEHGWRWGVPALALATLVGVSRINDNRHYLHDVLSGMTIGMMYGVGISKIDQVKRSSGEKDVGVSFVPLFDSTIRGISLYKEF